MINKYKYSTLSHKKKRFSNLSNITMNDNTSDVFANKI